MPASGWYHERLQGAALRATLLGWRGLRFLSRTPGVSRFVRGAFHDHVHRFALAAFVGCHGASFTTFAFAAGGRRGRWRQLGSFAIRRVEAAYDNHGVKLLTEDKPKEAIAEFNKALQDARSRRFELLRGVDRQRRRPVEDRRLPGAVAAYTQRHRNSTRTGRRLQRPRRSAC